MWFITTRTIALNCDSYGAITWSSFEDEKKADDWIKGDYIDGTPLSEIYEVLYSGPDEKRAMNGCRPPEPILNSLR